MMKCILQSEFINIDDNNIISLPICYGCGTTKSFRIRRGKITQQWFHNRDQDDNMLCNRCYARIISSRPVSQLSKEEHMKIKEIAKKTRVKNKEKLTIRRREYRKNNRELLNKQNLEYYHRNKESISLKSKIYRTENAEKLKQKRVENRDEISRKRKERRNSNKPEYLRKHREYIGAFRPKLIELLGGKCVRCDFIDIRALQIDHIHGGGNKEIKLFHNASMMYLYYIKNPELAKARLQILCANCNWIKRAEKNEMRSRIQI